MEELQQEYMLSIIFTYAVERERLLINKYHALAAANKKNAAVRELVKEFEEEAREHIELLKDKMIKLNIRG